MMSASSAATSKPWPAPKITSNKTAMSARIVVSSTLIPNTPSASIRKLTCAANARALMAARSAPLTLMVSNQVVLTSDTPLAVKPAAKMSAKRLMRDAMVFKPCGPWNTA